MVRMVATVLMVLINYPGLLVGTVYLVQIARLDSLPVLVPMESMVYLEIMAMMLSMVLMSPRVRPVKTVYSVQIVDIALRVLLTKMETMYK
jgi:hypothetical protein